ncbi:22309_t:CDS:2 [Cetraspora pellucida]|uniref:22309_t:CDS:1 n=1 Tax=Cetraspora pellucida TaxID=1433469 RepID=A0A9N9JCN6_9GLOM|nr:22309_t:CDS:2 [Cetraspora pellucida]
MTSYRWLYYSSFRNNTMLAAGAVPWGRHRLMPLLGVVLESLHWWSDIHLCNVVCSAGAEVFSVDVILSLRNIVVLRCLLLVLLVVLHIEIVPIQDQAVSDRIVLAELRL